MGESLLSLQVGEFSLASTDCTIYLSNGINGGCDMAADPSCVYKSGAEALSGTRAELL